MQREELLAKIGENLYKAKEHGRNRIFINKEPINEVDFENIEQKDINLSKLNRQINEVREILNEVCCTVDTTEAVNDRLKISQYLDRLIAEYMKGLNCDRKI